MDKATEGVPGLRRTRSLVDALLSAESAESVDATESTPSVESTESTLSADWAAFVDLRHLAQLLRIAQEADETKPATYHLSAEARDLVEWLRRTLPAGLQVPNRSDVVEAALRLAAGVVAAVVGEPLPGD